MTFEVYDDYEITLRGVAVAVLKQGLPATLLDEVKRLLAQDHDAETVADLKLELADADDELREQRNEIEELKAQLEVIG